MNRSILVFLFLLFTVIQIAAEETVPVGPLPRDVLPLSYNLSLNIFPDKETFSGKVEINLDITKETSVLWLHGKDLSVSRTMMKMASGKSFQAKYSQVDEGGVARIDLPKKMAPQKATLILTFEAPFNRRLEGLYHLSENGKHYAFTQFEAISARLCFPGFDEPSFKTPFDITLTVRQDHQAITTTLPLEESKQPDGTKRIRFTRTEKLPTYLIAFAVGPLDVVKGPDIPPNEFRKEAVPLRGVAVSGKGKQLAHALQNTGSILTALEQYFGIGYPFHKLDLIAIPDYEWGAMENAGAITFREGILLLDQDAPFSLQKRFASVMAHELAHQWFGNLVTMKWWDDIWLNERLTSWSDNQILEDWNREHKTAISAIQSSLSIMDRDSSASARPLHRPSGNATEIKTIADGLVFAKGAAVPQMFEHYLGKEKFQKLIRYYLQKHAFSNVTSEDFLRDTEHIAGKELAQSLRTFIYQAGVPYLEVQTACDQKKTTVTFKQSRYAPLGANLSSDQKWQIPVCIRYEKDGSPARKCGIAGPDSNLILEAESCADWVMPNAGGTGYYRWNLSPELWQDLRTSGLSHLSVQEQLSVIDSIQAAFAAGTIPASNALQVIEPFAASSTREIAMSPVEMFSFFHDYLLEPDQVESLRKKGRKWYRAAYEKFQFDESTSDSDDSKQFRDQVIEFLALEARDPEVRVEASKRGYAYIGFGTDGKLHPEAVGSNLVKTVLSVAAQEGDIGFVDALIRLLKESNDSLLRSRILSALGRATEPAKVEKILALSLDPALRTNEVLNPLIHLMDEKENWESVWRFLNANFDVLLKRMSPNDAGGVPLVASLFCSEEKALEVKAFFEKRVEKLAGGNRNLMRTLDTIRVCAAKVEHHRKEWSADFSRH